MWIYIWRFRLFLLMNCDVAPWRNKQAISWRSSGLFFRFLLLVCCHTAAPTRENEWKLTHETANEIDLSSIFFLQTFLQYHLFELFTEILTKGTHHQPIPLNTHYGTLIELINLVIVTAPNHSCTWRKCHLRVLRWSSSDEDTGVWPFYHQPLSWVIVVIVKVWQKSFLFEGLCISWLYQLVWFISCINRCTPGQQVCVHLCHHPSTNENHKHSLLHNVVPLHFTLSKCAISFFVINFTHPYIHSLLLWIIKYYKVFCICLYSIFHM